MCSLRTRHIALGSAVALGVGVALVACQPLAQDEPPFGDPESVAYAEALWQELEDARLVGPDAKRSFAYPFEPPHGHVLELIEDRLTVEGHTGATIVKTNFMGEELEPEDVMNVEREEFLDSTTVMFQREAGYDPDHNDWFWAKYLPGGELDRTPDDVPLAGRVQGCIGCHTPAPGDDMVFTHNRYGSQ